MSLRNSDTENFSDVKPVMSAARIELEARVDALRSKQTPDVLKTTEPFSKLPGFEELTFLLSDSRLVASGIEVKGNFYGVCLALNGTSANAVLRVDFDNGATNLYPGTKITGEFRNVVVTVPTTATAILPDTGAVVGTARLILFRRPDFRFEEQPSLPSGPTSAVTVGPSGAATQTYNVAVTATTNAPALTTDGVSLEGANSVRALVTSSNGGIASGRIRWWVLSGSNWFISTVSEDLNVEVTGNVRAATSDNFSPVGSRAYAELVLGTNAGGSGAFTVEIETGRS